MKKAPARRVPAQNRALVTVEAMLDATIKLLKRGGVSSITTNRIAETAGVSIGSVYQYFPNKQSIYIALHERHVDQVDSMIQRCMAKAKDATLKEFIASLLAGMIELHSVDPELSELLQAQVPQSPGGKSSLSIRLYEPIRKSLAARSRNRVPSLDMQAFFLSNMIDSFGHAIAIRRPVGLSLARGKAETLRAIIAYLHSSI